VQLEIIVREPLSVTRPRPILFVHGMWHAAWCWAEHFLLYFAQRGYASYALSLRGHGSSAGRERLRWTSLGDYVTDVAQVVEQMKELPVLVGHSMGGVVLQKYLESHQLPAAVLLASPSPRGVFRTTLRVSRRHPLAVLRTMATLSLYPLISSPARTREWLFSADLSEEALGAYFARLQDESFRAFLDMMILDLPRPKKLTTPLLVLGAAKDALLTRDDIETTAQAYGTQAEIISGVAHDMMLDSNWGAVADRIQRWLSESGL
jgi:alpha-beta hydrolase superfamily lysophospholipase